VGHREALEIKKRGKGAHVVRFSVDLLCALSKTGFEAQRKNEENRSHLTIYNPSPLIWKAGNRTTRRGREKKKGPRIHLFSSSPEKIRRKEEWKSYD